MQSDRILRRSAAAGHAGATTTQGPGAPGTRLTRGASDEDLVVSAAPFLKLSLEQMSQLFSTQDWARLPDNSNAALFGPGQPSGVAGGGHESRHPSRVGVRQFLTHEEGTGYWDHFNCLRHVFLSIMDATYRHTTWVDVHGEGTFKLRLLLSGRLYEESRANVLEGPLALLSLCPRGAHGGYYLAGGHGTRQVVLSCHSAVLTDTLGLEFEETPSILRGLARDESMPARSLRLDMGSKVFQAAMDVVTSRYEYSGAIRANFLEAKCREILCAVLGGLRSREMEQSTGSALSSRDLNRVIEARDYLVNHFRDPPSIPILARRVGVSQTRLKASFRKVTGMTIHNFVQQERMRRASEMLLSGEHYIAEVAYAVGYDHPANFTCAFRKFYGFLPRSLKPRRGP